ncbi:type II toxin-antitoxin system VapC family toxin [Candidatus Micrarchaeota archaeon]|nr:type II toxin-antitoxin system VapC family toxin [Candidatus Micrarchaeota archaeon]MBU1930796.1 type II toxin-antitoxin system VapC family toxin [Candidatus Micrarchaeota archaeon]
MSVLIDSSGWIEYFSNGKKANKFAPYIQKANKKNFITPTIILFEVYKKIKRETNESKANEAIAYIIDSTKIIGLDERIALHASETSIHTGLAMADAIIQATANLHKAQTITSDHHFKSLPNTKII